MMPSGMLLPYSRLRESSHPEMPIASTVTADGETVEVQVHTSVRDDRGISVGYPVGHRADGAVLVELPDEVLGGPHMGCRRIWVWPGKLRSKPTSIETLQTERDALARDLAAARARIADLEGELRTARAGALEEAARVADRWAVELDRHVTRYGHAAAIDIARDVRALAEPRS